jgi:exopolyphosphatase / guanosine-5'-triphosphate,3'-diphosphate pyrophosphatase
VKTEKGTLRGTEMINAIRGVGQAYGYEASHATQVMRLALRLFDDLQPLHGMGNTERIWLRAAAMLHDVGKRQDPKNHHKAAQEIIISSPKLPFRDEERVIIGLVARYHRGSQPQGDHKYYRDLDAETQLYVRKLASMLRLADGLDKGHCGLVEGLRCDIRRRRVRMRVMSREPLNIDSPKEKADLFESVFRRRVVLQVAAGDRGRSPALDFRRGLAYAGVN